MAMHNRESDDHDELSEMNLTPFIDVILVLLIIFMIAAQASTVSQSVTLPGSTAARLSPPKKPYLVAIHADGKVTLNDQPVAPGALAGSLTAAGAGPRDRVLLLGDQSISYKKLMSTLDSLRAGGFTQVGLVGVENGSTQ